MSFTPETAPPEKLIEAFSKLLPPERFVFSQQDAPALYELIDNLPDNDQAIARQLITWSQQQPKVFNALKSALNQRGPNESIPKPKPEDYKTLLKNKLRESFRETTKEQKPPKSSK
ncbi:MAG: hypothetical protein F6K58_22600 [Symploca sp. SIO2E9]|nr:hypothetical protein [Symploca sp. SIO2E9]